VSEEIPTVDQILLGTAVSLVNLAGIRLTEKEQKDPAQAKQAIDAARELLPLCPQDEIGPVKDALSQLQMLYVKETQGRAHPAEPGASRTADERAKARSKIWTPPGS
jgi:hypothetical protein